MENLNIIDLNELSDEQLKDLAIALEINQDLQAKVIAYLNNYRGYCIKIYPWGGCSLQD